MPILSLMSFSALIRNSKYSRKYAKLLEFYYFWSKWSNKFPKLKEKFVRKIKKADFIVIFVGRFICTLRYVYGQTKWILFLIYMKNVLNIFVLYACVEDPLVLNFVGNVAVCKRFMYSFRMDIATFALPHKRKRIRTFLVDKRFKFKDSFSTG